MTENLKLELSRVIKTSRQRAFAAWTQREELMRWFAPGVMQATAIDVDPRVGGIFRWTMQAPPPQAGPEITFSGEFLEIVEDQLLRFSWQAEGNAEDLTIVEVAFRDVEGGVEVAVTQERIASAEIYNRNKGGWDSMLDKLVQQMEPSVAHAG